MLANGGRFLLVNVPDDRRVVVQLPDDTPAGEVRLSLYIHEGSEEVKLSKPRTLKEETFDPYRPSALVRCLVEQRPSDSQDEPAFLPRVAGSGSGDAF